METLESKRQLTLKHMEALNNLLETDKFAERFYDGGSMMVGKNERFLLKMGNPLEKDKSIRLVILDDPDLTFLNNFYDADDLDLEEEDTIENFESNLKKIHSLLKPILDNEIISINGLCNGHLFNAIFNRKQLNSNLDSHYINLDFKVWNGNVDDDIIEKITKKNPIPRI